MNVLLDLRVLGGALVALGLLQLLPAGAAWLLGEPALPYAASALAALVFGVPVVYASRPTQHKLRPRDSTLIVAGVWGVASLFGAIPYLTTDVLGPLDALFESVAGFTTTAASALPSVEQLPRALLVWRAMTQWLGGAGVLLVAVSLLPAFGVGGMQLLAAELGPAGREIARARFVETGLRVLAVYAGLTVAAYVALWIAGLSPLEALCHALSGASTGGFSTRDASVAAFASAPVEWILIAVMLLGATSFLIQLRAIAGPRRRVPRDPELRTYAALAASSALLLAWIAADASDGVPVRGAVFQAVSMLSGTGYVVADYSLWPSIAQLLLLALVVVGGMAASTSGGLSSLRLLLGMRAVANSFARLLHPQLVRRVKYAKRPVPDDVIAELWAFFTAYFLVVAAAAVAVASAGYDLLTAVSTAFSATANVGPALGAAGPGGGYAQFPGGVKLALAACMLAGRLDVFTVFAILQPRFWTR